MFITRCRCPRTFLRGMGATLALPLLDAMVPARDAAGATAARTAAAVRRRLHPATARSWRSGRRRAAGPDFEFTPILKPLEAVPRSLVVVSNLCRAGRDGHRRPRRQLGGLADRRRSRSGPRPRTCARAARSTRWSRKQIGQDTPFPSLEAGDRGLHRLRRRLRAGLQLRVHEHDLVDDADDAAADGDQPARGVRADVRPRGHARAAPARACGTTGASSTRSRGRRARSAARARRRATARGSSEYLDNIREIERRIQRGPRQRNGNDVTTLGRADRRARLVRGARRPDVRPAGGGVPGRPDARVHVHDVARAQPADVSADRRDRAAPHHLAPRERPGQDRGAHEDQHLPRRSCSRSSWRRCRRRRTATARCSITR